MDGENYDCGGERVKLKEIKAILDRLAAHLKYSKNPGP